MSKIMTCNKDVKLNKADLIQKKKGKVNEKK